MQSTQSYRLGNTESGAFLSEGLAGLAREAEVEDSLRRHRLRKLDALSSHRDHLSLQLFVDNAGQQVALDRGLIGAFGKPVAFLAEIKVRSLHEFEGIGLVVLDQPHRAERRANHF